MRARRSGPQPAVRRVGGFRVGVGGLTAAVRALSPQRATPDRDRALTDTSDHHRRSPTNQQTITTQDHTPVTRNPTDHQHTPRATDHKQTIKTTTKTKIPRRYTPRHHDPLVISVGPGGPPETIKNKIRRARR